MQITLITSKVSISCDLQEHEVNDLLRTAMRYVTGEYEGRKCVHPVEVIPVQEPAVPSHDIRDLQKTRPNPEEEGYKGFLYIKCEDCGTIKGYCSKTPRHFHRCECGHETPLKDLEVMRVNCVCGADFKYRTNLTEDIHTMTCMNCGQPVELEHNVKRRMYQTMGHTREG